MLTLVSTGAIAMSKIVLRPTYGSWELIEEVEPLKGKGRNVTRRLKVRCSLCGDVKIRNLYPLNNGQSKNCRCATRKHHFKVGQQVGLLTVLEVGVQDGRDKPRKIRVLCDCGAEKLYLPSLLSRMASCGCRKLRKGSDSPLWKGCGGISGSYWLRLQQGAQDRELPFDITIEQAWALFEEQEHCCALTGFDLVFVVGRGDANQTTASVDRIDSTKGYTLDNIQWVHKDVNWMKGSLPPERFLNLCRAIVTHQCRLIHHIHAAAEAK